MLVHPKIAKLERNIDRESSRYALNGIQLRRRGDYAEATATDGRQLVKVRWYDNGENKEFPAQQTEVRDGFEAIIDPKALANGFKIMQKRPLKDLHKMAHLSESESVLDNVRMTVVTEAGPVEQPLRPIEGRFPKHDDLLHKTDEEREAAGFKNLCTLNARIVVQVLQSLIDVADANGQSGATFDIWHKDAERMVYIVGTKQKEDCGERKHEFTGIVMPLSR